VEILDFQEIQVLVVELERLGLQALLVHRDCQDSLDNLAAKEVLDKLVLTDYQVLRVRLGQKA